MYKTLFEDPSQPTFQLFIDVSAIIVLIITQTITALSHDQYFDENYLSLFYALKAMLCLIPFCFVRKITKELSPKLFVMRAIYDIAMVFGAVMMVSFKCIRGYNFTTL